MDDEIKGDNIMVENEGIVEYSKDFIKCKILHSKQKKLVVIYQI